MRATSRKLTKAKRNIQRRAIISLLPTEYKRQIEYQDIMNHIEKFIPEVRITRQPAISGEVAQVFVEMEFFDMAIKSVDSLGYVRMLTNVFTKRISEMLFKRSCVIGRGRS